MSYLRWVLKLNFGSCAPRQGNKESIGVRVGLGVIIVVVVGVLTDNLGLWLAFGLAMEMLRRGRVASPKPATAQENDESDLPAQVRLI